MTVTRKQVPGQAVTDYLQTLRRDRRSRMSAGERSAQVERVSIAANRIGDGNHADHEEYPATERPRRKL